MQGTVFQKGERKWFIYVFVMGRGMSRNGVLPKKESLSIWRKNVRNSVERSDVTSHETE